MAKYNLGSMFAGMNFSGWVSTFMNILQWIGVTLIVGAILWVIWRHYKAKAIYTNGITAVRLLDNGITKEQTGLKGGIIKGDAGIRDYEILMPKNKKKKLGYIPDFSKADANGNLLFLVIGDGTIWQQMEKRIQEYEEVTQEGVGTIKYRLIMKPIPTDVKQATLNNLRTWREILSKDKLKAGGMIIGGFIIMVIAHLISLYIQTKIKCPACPAVP